MKEKQIMFAIVGTNYQYDDNNYSARGLDDNVREILYKNELKAHQDCNELNLKASGMGDDEGVTAPWCVIQIDFYPKQSE